MEIKPAELQQAQAWERMRRALWPDESDDHGREIAQYFAGTLRQVAHALIACDEQGGAIGFAEMSIRPYAEGCDSGRVAFLEGWFVEPVHRRTGVGAALVRAVEAWGRARGCTELGSDTQSYNRDSVAAHRALGFEEVETIVCFRKSL
jgi:aminoglycoside 6'-N-acetyltransferase I